jgi:hypothetical protein
MVGLPDLLRSFLPCKQSLLYLQAVINLDSFYTRRGVIESGKHRKRWGVDMCPRKRSCVITFERGLSRKDCRRFSREPYQPLVALFVKYIGY